MQNTYSKSFLKYCKKKRVGGGLGQRMWIVINFYNIIIKSSNVDKEGG